MAQKKRLTKKARNARRSGKNASARRRTGRTGLSLSASVESSNPVSMREVLEFYKPIKKPVTLRLDADVLAWFKRDGRRYQTRINGALRIVMEREMNESE
ncbi:MAG TPA: BrnA antitoxin family protein [Candidatus Sulfotelmatobacter sp.]|jgi:uncharacterized protein (DUF4415 family)